ISKSFLPSGTLQENPSPGFWHLPKCQESREPPRVRPARYALLLLFLLKDQLAVDFADVTHRLPVTV
ncbi:MAG TPA: hypothetical protein VEL31_24465, partial [Ktedonobacteraceae bacterium]|nr:hypothetical protein [Ktedonobacteraceae bacterium]